MRIAFLSAGALSNISSIPEPWGLVLIIAGGLVALVLVVLLARLLVYWWARRRALPSEPPMPVEAPELYDLRTADVTEDIRFYVEIARQVGGPVLELGAGTGRVTLPLAKTGLVVTGLETSRLMLQRAKLKAEQLSPKLRVEWVEGDMTNFALGGRKFRLILAPFHVLQELRDLTDLEKCLRLVAEHLEPDGKFVAVVQAPHWETLKFEHRFLKTVYNARTNELITCYQSLDVDPIWHELRGAYEYQIWDHAGRMREVIAPFRGCYVTCPEMVLLLRAARMELETVYGSFSREPLTRRSQQMIFVARLLPVAAQPAAGPAALPASVPAQTPALVGAGSASTAASPSAAPAASPASASAAVLPASPSPAQGASASPPAGGPPTLSLPALPPKGETGKTGTTSAASASQAQGLQAPSSSLSGRRQTGQRRSQKQGK